VAVQLPAPEPGSFGRTVRENGSGGTDHGTAAPVFLAGPGVKGGLVEVTPSLLDPDLKHPDLRRLLDFRQVSATVLESWLRLPSRENPGADPVRLSLFRAGSSWLLEVVRAVWQASLFAPIAVWLSAGRALHPGPRASYLGILNRGSFP
jgi:hypothetical protein